MLRQQETCGNQVSPLRGLFDSATLSHGLTPVAIHCRPCWGLWPQCLDTTLVTTTTARMVAAGEFGG